MGKRVEPDDYYRRGPLEFARFGNQTIMRSNWGKGQQEKYIAELIERIPAVQQEITELVENAAAKIFQHPNWSSMRRRLRTSKQNVLAIFLPKMAKLGGTGSAHVEVALSTRNAAYNRKVLPLKTG